MTTAETGATTNTAAGIDDGWCRHHFDHLSQDLADNLQPTLARMRSLCPVAHSDQYGGFWVVTSYDRVLSVAQDWRTWSSAFGLTVPVSPIAVRNLPVEVDPPRQKVFKRLINAFLTPAAVAPWEAHSRVLARGLIDRFVETGECDFMAEFARPFPALMFFESAIGAPPDQVERVAYLASKSGTPNDPDAAECWAGLSAWINDFIEERRRSEPRGDVVDAVIAATVEGRPITQEEVIGTVQLLILGGLETTAGALGQMVIRFCEEPWIAEILRRDPGLIPTAVEELLRLEGPFISIARTATCDTEIDGHPIKKGEKVIIYWASANRDASEFPDPDTFRLDRGSNRHLAFGAGPHRCAGSNLARMNLRVALEELLPRLVDLRLQPEAEIHFHSTFNRAPLSVPVAFTPGPKSA